MHRYVAYNRSYGHLRDFLAYFCQNLDAVATPLRPLQSETSSLFFGINQPRKPPVISNRIVVISSRNVFICNDSNFSPKIGCHGNAPLSLVHGVSQVNSPIAQTLSEKNNSAWICCIQLKLWPFCYFWPNLAKIWLPWQRPLDPFNQKCLLSIGRPQKPLL